MENKIPTSYATFEKWYEDNKNYYIVKHGNDEKAMEKEAQESYNKMISFTGEPKKTNKKTSNK